jgi:hypothetical protein
VSKYSTPIVQYQPGKGYVDRNRNANNITSSLNYLDIRHPQADVTLMCYNANVKEHQRASSGDVHWPLVKVAQQMSVK